MQEINDNIDLDALFDMLNIVGGQAEKSSAKSEKATISQYDAIINNAQDLSPLDADFFIVDLPTDQS